MLVLELDDNLVGFASLCPSRDKDTDQKFYAEISALYLHPDVWFKGLGKELCSAAIAELDWYKNDTCIYRLSLAGSGCEENHYRC